MDEPFDIEERWPKLFEELEARQRRAVVQSLASSWHEGWVPDREDVADLVAEATGEIDAEEYRRRTDAKAERLRGTGGRPSAAGASSS
ncbi:antitoxin VbhA family protein [Frigoribacterium salinisoli]